MALEQQGDVEGLPATEHQILGAQTQRVVGGLVLLVLQVHILQQLGLLLFRGEERWGGERRGGEEERRRKRGGFKG